MNDDGGNRPPQPCQQWAMVPCKRSGSGINGVNGHIISGEGAISHIISFPGVGQG